MGTRWRGLLAPIDKPTGDGRRMAKGSFRHRELPLPLKWQREDDMGHDASVVIGLMDSIKVDEKAGEVWGEGELFDDQEGLPRLTEDVMEAVLLTSKKVIGPSVDGAAAEAILVEPGSDEPITEERMEELWAEAMESGSDPVLELLFTDFEIAAATLVSIPAFAEARPFELVTSPAKDDEKEDEDEPVPADAALVASLTAAVPSIPADVFAPPDFDSYTELAVEDRGEGFLRVAGHYAAHGTCHLEFPGACVTPPLSQADYAPFHRYPIETSDGELVAVGRITSGFGRVGTGCSCCRGKDDHACTGFGLGDTISHYDPMATLAWVKAGEDEHGLYVVGVADAALADDGRRVLEGRKFSGDWRDYAGHLELVELLGLTVGKPGFPAPKTAMRDGRQTSLVACFTRPVATLAAGVRSGPVDYGRIGREVAAAMAPLHDAIRDFAQGVQFTRTVAADTLTAAQEQTEAVVALVPHPDHAQRLAVDGGEPADRLHLTLLDLGTADDIDDEVRNQIVEAVWNVAEASQPVEGDGFALSEVDLDGAPAVVVGVGGDGVDSIRTAVAAAVGDVFTVPDQHDPFTGHVAVAHTDLGELDELADGRTGPVVFDRLRIAFAGRTTDIAIGPPPPPEDEATVLAIEVEAAYAAVDADLRAREAAALQRELELVDV